MPSETDIEFMQRALALALKAQAKGEVPVGAVLVMDGVIIGEGFNQPISSNDPTAHAELVAIRQAASRINNYRLPGSTLYVTLEPCTMCVGAMMHARIEQLVFAADEPRAGAVKSAFQLTCSEKFNHSITVNSGILADESSRILKEFFAARRKPK